MTTLYSQVISFANLLEAAEGASRGKRFRPNVARFSLFLEEELHLLKEELTNRTYRPGPYRTFVIREKKPRLISAAPFRDRVVHHALCNVIEPMFDRSFLYDSYACRKGKGTHAAIDRTSAYARRFPYVLKCDIEKYFPSIDHDVLLERLGHRIRDQDVRWLIQVILDGNIVRNGPLRYFPGDTLFTPIDRKRGIPIGNQTSQFFANVYLDGLDHWLKETVRVPGYIRYVDDSVVFARDKAYLHHVHRQIEEYLNTLRVRLHPRKCFVAPTRAGFTFLGYRIFPTYRRLDADNVRRFKRRLRAYRGEVESGRMDVAKARECVQSWVAHASHANTRLLRSQIFSTEPWLTLNHYGSGLAGQDSPTSGIGQKSAPRGLLEQ